MLHDSRFLHPDLNRDRDPHAGEPDPEHDRRSSRRAPLDVLANRFLDGYPYLCRATDISRRGMRLHRFNEPEARSRFVGLQFQLPGSEEVITASGEVISRDEEDRSIGIRFTHLSTAAAAAIERYLARTPVRAC